MLLKPYSTSLNTSNTIKHITFLEIMAFFTPVLLSTIKLFNLGNRTYHKRNADYAQFACGQFKKKSMNSFYSAQFWNPFCKDPKLLKKDTTSNALYSGTSCLCVHVFFLGLSPCTRMQCNQTNGSINSSTETACIAQNTKINLNIHTVISRDTYVTYLSRPTH